jgi:hypothetical protein
VQGHRISVEPAATSITRCLLAVWKGPSKCSLGASHRPFAAFAARRQRLDQFRPAPVARKGSLEACEIAA